MSRPASERPASELRLDRALREAFGGSARGERERARADASMPSESVCRAEAEIARGGMGIVYRARDPVLGREVALKLLHEEQSGDPAAVERFVEEARVGGMLQHPGIVPVYACGRTQTGRPWFTMKLIEGQTLASLLAARPSPAHEQGRFLAILESACRTIAFAHARGVVHLDLKPGNVMVGAFGEVQVVDWGLAALLSGTSRAAGRSPRTGEVCGTPAYMPPEQARGVVGAIDGRADLFALGAILCEILTGDPPYPEGRAASRQAAAAGQLDGARARLAAANPAELGALCLRCLEEQPGARPRDASEIADGIARTFANLETRARAAEIAAAREGERARHERRARRWTVAFAAAVLVSVLGAVAAWSAWSRGESTRRQGVDSRAGESLGEAARVLGQAESSRDEALYAQALAAIDRAQAALASGEGSSELRERAAALRERVCAEQIQARLEAGRMREGAVLLRRLEELRVPVDEDAYPSDAFARDGAFAAAFAEIGLHPDQDDPARLAAALRSRGIAVEVAGQLDEWLETRRGACIPGAERLRELAQRLDPDPARSAIRSAIERASFVELERLARSPDLAGCRAGTLHALVRAILVHPSQSDRTTLAAVRAVHLVRPDDYPITVELARCAFRSGPESFSEAEQLYRLAQALRPERATAFLELGWELEHLDLDYAEAAELERRAIELQPDSEVAYFCFGRALRGLGDLDGSLAAQGEAARLLPSDPRPRKEIAVLNRLNGSFERSLREFEALLEVWPGYEMARTEYALALFDAGRTADALAQLQRLITLDDGARAKIERIEARMLLERGACAEAARLLHGARTDSEDSLLPLFLQGVRLQDYLDVAALSRCVEQKVASDPSRAETQCQLGALLDARGCYAAALVAFRSGHALSAGLQAWRYPSSGWLVAAERRAALEPRLVELLGTRASPQPTEDALELAGMAARKGRPEFAARWFAELFEREPARAAEPDARLEAACAAIAASERAAAGADAAAEAEPVRWRTLARGWLRDELERRAAEVRGVETAPEAGRALGAWQVATELAGVRDAQALARLPQAERESWAALWSSASALCDEAQRRSAGIPRPR